MNCPRSPNGTVVTDPALQYNADIAGLGVRLSFYFQNFILVLLVDRSYEDAENALWTFIATSFGLTVAALGQVGINGLTLLEGILVSQLAWLANIGTFLALASYSRSKGEDSIVKFAAVMQGYFSMVLTIVMWAYADTFKVPEPNTPPIQFVFMFAWPLPALRSGRVVALVFSALTIIIYTGVTITECRAWLKHGRSRLLPASQELDSEIVPRTAERARSGSVSSAFTFHQHKVSTSDMRSQKRRRPPARTQWLGTEVDPIFFGIFLSQVIVFAYFISTTELILTKSNACYSDASQWGFGQVLALTVVIPSIIALYRAIHKNRIARVRRVEKEKREDDNWHSYEVRPSTAGHWSPGPKLSGSFPRSPPSPSPRPKPSQSMEGTERPFASDSLALAIEDEGPSSNYSDSTAD